MKGLPSCEQFVQDTAECPNIRSSIDLLASGLLWRHVCHCPGNCAGNGTIYFGGHRGERGLCGPIPERFRESEIQDLDGSVRRQLYIGGLEITVNDSTFMSGCQSVGNLLCDFQCLIQRNGP